MITQDIIKGLLVYEPDSGLFRSRRKTCRSIPGSVIGAVRPDGYLQIYVLGRNYLAHRLAWLYVHGTWPEVHIDHIDGDGTNNRIENLRLATPAENGRNRTRPQARNSSGERGVYWSRIRKKWIAQIGVDRRTINLGGYDTKAEAKTARKAAEINHYGQFRGTA